MESFEKRVESLAPDEPVSDKLNRLAYAGAESVRQEIAERVDRSLKDPLQAAVGFGEQSVAGLMLGSLNKLSTPGNLLVGAIGTGLAASVLKEEASPEKLAQICSTAKSLMDSSSNIDSKIYSMKKTFAPLVLDVGPMIMGFLSGRALNKKKVKSEQPLEWRANGKVVEKKRGITKIYFKHSDGKFYWPFSQDAKEQKLFRQLNKAQQSFGEESFAVGEKRRLLADHFRKNGKLEESGYHYEKAEQATKTAMVRLDAGESGGCVDLGDKAYGQRLKLAEKHLLLAEDQYLKARDMQARNPLEAAKFYDQSALHYKTGIALHSPENNLRMQAERSFLNQSLDGSYKAHYQSGNLPAAYESLSRKVTKPDGSIEHGADSMKLANLCEEMNFHGEAEQLYRDLLKERPIALKWAQVERHPLSLLSEGLGGWQLDALKGIVNCLERRGKADDAKELSSVVRRFHFGFLSTRGNLARDIAKINRVLNNTKEFSLEQSDFPTVLIPPVLI